MKSLDAHHALRGFAATIAFACLTPSWTAAETAEDDDPARPTAVETVEVPVTPTGLFTTLAPYENTRQAAFASWAPNGQGLLIRTRFGNSAQLHRVLRPGGRREQLTFFSEPARGRFVPADPQGDLLLSMNRNGDERDQIYLLEPRDFRVTMLTDGRTRNMLGPVSADGRKMIVRSNKRNGRDMDVYMADVRRKKSMKLLHRVTDEYWYGSHWSADGQELLMRRHVSVAESEPALYDVRSESLTLLPRPTDKPASYNLLRFSPTGEQIYLTTDAFGEHRELVRFDRSSDTYQRLTADLPWSIDELTIDRTTGVIAFTLNAAGVSRLYLLTPDGERTPVELPESAILRDLRFKPGGEELGFTLHTPVRPGDVYSMPLADKRLRRWTYSVVGGLNPRRFVSPKVVTIRSFDGLEFDAFLYRPPGATDAEPAPVIVSLHGGPESQYRPYFSPAIQYFVHRLGCAVLCPNVRGSTGYGKTFASLDNGLLREDSIRDVGALLDWIDAQSDLDSSRIVVRGRSYGGYMTLATLATYGDRLCAGVDTVGIANFRTFLERTESYRRARRRVEYGDERDEATRAFFNRIAPANQVKRITAPLLVIHGVNDPRVPFSEATKIVNKLQALERDVWAVWVGDEGHSFSKKNNVSYVNAVESMFLRKHLSQPKERGEPSNARENVARIERLDAGATNSSTTNQGSE